MSIVDKVRDRLRSFLRMEPDGGRTVVIHEDMDFDTRAFCNRLWYRGNAYELDQFYSQVKDDTLRFWGARSTKGLEVRKIHSGLPKIIVNTLVNIILRDLNDIYISNGEQNSIWEKTAEENKIDVLLSQALRDTLVTGDGAFKISLDADMSKYPIVEWYPSEQVDFVYDRGRLAAVDFKDEIHCKNICYTLHQRYGFGYVAYSLTTKDGKKIDMTQLDETKDLQDVVFDKSFMLAVPFIITPSDEWKGRGASVFDGKSGNFDALDEAWSQWAQALRASRPTRYMPDRLVPRDENDGTPLKPNAFDNQYVQIGSDVSENAQNRIVLDQPTFPAEAYGATYSTALDLCLQGLISPSTLGIDTKKLDNAEAQREKEKTTLYTRNNIINAFSPVLKRLVETVIQAWYTAERRNVDDIDIDVTFGEYANPSFEAVVETLSNPNTPMSIESKVDEMWGDSKDDEWKAEEVRRIKEQQGIVTMEEPALGKEVDTWQQNM